MMEMTEGISNHSDIIAIELFSASNDGFCKTLKWFLIFAVNMKTI